MSIESVKEVKTCSHSFELTVDCPIERLWSILCDDIDKWWLDDFRALGEGSQVSLVPSLGGGLWEKSADGGCLEWYRVQMCEPGKSIYLTGYLAADWGGPTLSMLKIVLSADGGVTKLTFGESLMGNVTEKSCPKAEENWRVLIGDGLKKFAEGG